MNNERMNSDLPELIPHHVGCAVQSLDAALDFYSKAGLTRATRRIHVASQSVDIRFLELGRGVYLELIEPSSPESAIDRYLKAGFYHLCFLVPSIEQARERFSSAGAVGLPPFHSEAFDGSTCQFFLTPPGALIETTEMSAQAFLKFFTRSVD